MAQNPLEQLHNLSDSIRQEEQNLWFDLWGNLIDPETEPDAQNDAGKNRKEWSARLLLRSLRIKLCLALMDADPSQCRKQLLEDWADSVDAVRKLSGALDSTGEVLSDTLDLVLLLNPGSRQPLLQQLDLRTRLKIRKRCPLSREVSRIALDMADYCLETDRTDLVRLIAKNLILLGEKRNADHPKLQRMIIVDALEYIVDLDRPLSARLCERQQKYFEGTVDAYACNFFWFYGVSLLDQGNSPRAMELHKHCYDLCMAVEGETSWIGAQAGSIYHYSLLGTHRSQTTEDYLWDVVRKIEQGFYRNMDKDNREFVAAYNRFMLLHLYWDRGQLRNYLDDILALLFYCVSVRETTRNPYLTVRRAENLLSAYHLEVGEPLLAAHHAKMALDSIPPNGLPREPSDILLYTNLLHIYKQLHDAEQIDFYTKKLLDLSEEWENDAYLSDRIDALIFSNDSILPPKDEDLEYNRELLRETYEKLHSNSLIPTHSVINDTTYAWSVISICVSLLDSPTVSQEELLQIRYILDYFRSRPELYRFTDPQMLAYFCFQAQIEDTLGGPDALKYLDQAWQRINCITPGIGSRITVLRGMAASYCAHGENARSLEAANLLLSDVTAAWQQATVYFNDRRVCQVLSTVQTDFNLCYSIMRRMLSSRELYEQLLRFKDLPALVGRERNTLLRQKPLDDEILRDLHDVQDRLADAELNDSLRGTDTARELRQTLEMVEAGISAQFPEKVRFTEISFQKVSEKLPENCAIVEYYFSPMEEAVSQATDDSMTFGLDIFVTTKAAGQSRFHHLQCRDGNGVWADTNDFIQILQDPDDLSASGRKAQLRARLYRQLISPVLPLLEGITQLYIAPDESLCNLPFEILYGEDRIPLQDRYRICRLVCGRDLLFYDDETPSGGGSFILGDPNYEAQRGQRSQSRTRSGQGSLEPVDALPFSGVEARRVGRRCRSSVCTGDAATKYALRDALPCRIIHLATHGAYDESTEADSLYGSHLVFAGYNQWARNQTESSHCGNGILTADEISRMNLKKTELVVLSACQSGLGDISYGTVRGLLSAFSAAGARWVVSHLWAASDFSTPILMDAFYDALLKQGQEVPEALRYAKNYLKTVTIAQLRRDGWLELPRDIHFPAEVREAVEEMNLLPDREMPFQDEFYWGGFTVHKSR